MTACVGVLGMRVLAAEENRDEGMKVGIYDEVSLGWVTSLSQSRPEGTGGEVEVQRLTSLSILR